jgi:hypothetical protein
MKARDADTLLDEGRAVGPVEIVIIVVVLALLVGAIVFGLRKRRSSQLQDRFGPEYERTVNSSGDRRAAESELTERQRRHDELEIRPLDPQQRDRYRSAWRDAQSRFVDEPGPAVHEAHVLIAEVMRERGYPVDDFETRSIELSVDHPDVVQDYRAGHELARASDRGDASTEDLRQAMRHFRALFERLVDADSATTDRQGH